MKPKYDDPKRQKEYERKKRWRVANPEKARASVENFYVKNPQARREKHLQRKYGIGLQDLYMVLDLQRGGCAICGARSPGRKGRGGKESEWIVDHDHSTGKVRGVVCHPCNVIMGLAKDNPTLLRDIAHYLERAHVT